MSDPNDLISIYEAANSTEAYLVKDLLQDEGIDAEVSEENAPLAALPITPPHVLVRQSDQARASVLIEQYDAEQLRRAARPDWKCAACGAEVVGAFDECDACGAPRPGSEDE